MRCDNQVCSYPNVDPFIGSIISADKAKLHELRTIYDLEDAMDLWEIIAVEAYNKYLALPDT